MRRVPAALAALVLLAACAPAAEPPPPMSVGTAPVINLVAPAGPSPTPATGVPLVDAPSTGAGAIGSGVR